MYRNSLRTTFFSLTKCTLMSPVLALMLVGASASAEVVYKEDGTTISRKWGTDLDEHEKCTEKDGRIWNFCLTPDLFDATTRVYIDTGTDDPNEVDIFADGSLTPTFEIFGVSLPWRVGRSDFYDKWTWGPFTSVGIGAAAKDSENTMTQASDSPVILLSYGLTLQYKLADALALGVEFGFATGFSSAEGFDDIDDTAAFVGIRFKSPGGAQNTN